MKRTPVQLGQDMWQMLAGAFKETAEANKITTLPDKAQLWAGFMSAAGGAMTGDIGGENTHAILVTVAQACRDISKEPLPVKRPDLKVVKP